MNDQVEAKGGMMHPSTPHMPTMVAPTFVQRLCQLLHQRVNVSLNCEGATAPVAGTLHAVGQDYLELMNGTTANAQITIIPLWNVCAVQVAGAMDTVCPPPVAPPGTPQYPVSPGMGMGPGMMPGCPPGMPGQCPPSMGHPGMMGPGMGPGMMGPGMMMDVKDVKEEEKE